MVLWQVVLVIQGPAARVVRANAPAAVPGHAPSLKTVLPARLIRPRMHPAVKKRLDKIKVKSRIVSSALFFIFNLRKFCNT